MRSKSFFNWISGEKVVYLSPDAEEELEGLDEDTVYVIGGLVDDSVKSQVSLLYQRI